MKNQELFVPGQMVTWGERDETMKFVTADLGPGPFRICTVHNILADKCSCGGSFNDEAHRAYAKCPYDDYGYGRVRDSVGHPQLVTIDDGTGKPLTRKLTCHEADERVRRFSGRYFQAI